EINSRDLAIALQATYVATASRKRLHEHAHQTRTKFDRFGWQQPITGRDACQRISPYACLKALHFWMKIAATRSFSPPRFSFSDYRGPLVRHSCPPGNPDPRHHKPVARALRKAAAIRVPATAQPSTRPSAPPARYLRLPGARFVRAHPALP